ncbi:hypothetical protein [Adhaeribacter aquaticus]|uniref:hypothetical protein n=1 Tax=Adhaeribacter aquaticus TaxID=299567 RepID=UPI000421495A|nr:hypothetical protein [Adhaeribacter aquaticus]
MKNNANSKREPEKSRSGISIPAAIITILVFIFFLAWYLFAEKKSTERHAAPNPSSQVENK